MIEADGKTDWQQAARELLWHLRGERSQRGLARELGYGSNVVWGWEAGRRFPSAGRFLVVCEALGVEVVPVLRAFAPWCAGRLLGISRSSDVPVGAWLDALRGGRTTKDLARSGGVSTHALRRWLKGTAQPRLPDFLRVVEAATDRVCELTRDLVPRELVPAFCLGLVPALADHQMRKVVAKRRMLSCPLESR